jgi:hypothetical protein
MFNVGPMSKDEWLEIFQHSTMVNRVHVRGESLLGLIDALPLQCRVGHHTVTFLPIMDSLQIEKVVFTYGLRNHFLQSLTTRQSSNTSISTIYISHCDGVDTSFVNLLRNLVRSVYWKDEDSDWNSEDEGETGDASCYGTDYWSSCKSDSSDD